VRLSSEARTELKSVLRDHPAIREHLPRLHDLNRMNKEKLIELAQKLGVDVADIAAKLPGKKTRPAPWRTPEGQARWNHSHNYPAFKGVIEFDLEIGMLGKKVTRKARVTYTYTPEWEYFDLQQNRVMEGWAGDSMTFDVLAVPEIEVWVTKEGQRESTRMGPEWTRVSDLLQIGVISEAMQTALDDEIEKRAKAEDRQRRRAASRQ